MRNNYTAQLLALDSCAVSDALDSMGLPPSAVGIAPLTVPQKIAGSIITVKLLPGSPPGGSNRHLGTAAIAAASPGQIIAIQHAPGIECAGWGGVLSVGAQLRGVGGVILDGPARDIDEARALEFPVYATSAIARTARGRVYEADFNCAVDISGIAVAPGDYALADASAVVFVPARHVDEILRRAKRIVAREQLMVEALRNGQQVTDVVGRDYEAMLDELE